MNSFTFDLCPVTINLEVQQQNCSCSYCESELCACELVYLGAWLGQLWKPFTFKTSRYRVLIENAKLPM